MLRRSFLFLLTALPPLPGETDPERRQDVYAIYSLIMTNPPTSHGPEGVNEVYLIRDTTIRGNPQKPCVRPPAQNERAYDDVLADYERRKDTPVTLEPALNITTPYRLLTPPESQQFIDFRWPRPGLSTNPLFQKSVDLFGLVDVYFDRDRTLALTGVSTFCGGLCGSFRWKVFEKTHRGRWGWEERGWTTCMTIA